MPIERNGIMFSDAEPTELMLEATRQALGVFLFEKFRRARPGPKLTRKMREEVRRWLLPAMRWERCFAHLSAKAVQDERPVDETTIARETDAWIGKHEPPDFPAIYVIPGLRRPGTVTLLWQHEILMLASRDFEDVAGRLDQSEAEALRAVYRDRSAPFLGPRTK